MVQAVLSRQALKQIGSTDGVQGRIFQTKEDCNTLRKLISKSKPEKMTPDDLTAIRCAMQQLESSSANVQSIFQGMNQE